MNSSCCFDLRFPSAMANTLLDHPIHLESFVKDHDFFNGLLDQMAEAIPKKTGKRHLLVMDNASWHKSKSLNWHHFEPIYLPAYSPDFNPIERLWLRLKADWFYDFFAKTTEELTDRICTALNSFVQSPDKTASICSIRK